MISSAPNISPSEPRLSSGQLPVASKHTYLSSWYIGVCTCIILIKQLTPHWSPATWSDYWRIRYICKFHVSLWKLNVACNMLIANIWSRHNVHLLQVLSLASYKFIRIMQPHALFWYNLWDLTKTCKFCGSKEPKYSSPGWISTSIRSERLKALTHFHTISIFLSCKNFV